MTTTTDLAYDQAQSILGACHDVLTHIVSLDPGIDGYILPEHRGLRIVRHAMEYLHNTHYNKPHTSPTDEELQHMIMLMELTA